MSNDDLNGDDKLVNDLIDAIKFRLEFLERALRDSDRRVPSWTDTNLNSDDDEGSTSTVFDQKMSDVLSRDNWDTYLVKIVRKFVHIRAKRESTKSSFEDPALIDAITTSLRSKAKQTLLRNNITQDVRAGDRENQEQTKKTLRAQARADAFIGQHVTYFFVQRTLADDTSTVEESLADWRAWAPREIVSFYDAAIAEILAGRRVVGALSAFYFDQSLKAARDVHFADYTRLAQYSNFTVPARKEITTALLASSADNRDALLHGLLPDAHLVAHVIRDLLLKNRIVEIARWINGLISPCKSKSNEGQKRVLGLSDTRPKEKPRQARPTTGRSTHIFDPDRILKVTAAATEISASTDSNLADSDNARIISDAKRDFILACVLVSAGQQPDPKPKLAPARSEDNWKLLSDLETIWWNSFDSTSQSPPWNATKIIEFCSGKTAAQWQKSHSGATRSRIRNAFKPKTLSSDKPSVTVFGAGVAGLTAAHELAERGFEVVVVEAISAPQGADELAVRVGGLARTQWCKNNSGAQSPQRKIVKLTPVDAHNLSTDLPGEHGYRFFPSFYHHLFDTMKRTPIIDPRATQPGYPGVYPTAFDQLQPTNQQVFAQRSSFVPISRNRPRSLESFRKEYMNLLEGLGFSRRDLSRFFFKLVRYLTSCSARRETYEAQSLLDFLGGPSAYSPAFLAAIKAAPQALVAMDAETCDARTQANIYLQLLLDQVLGGPYVDGTLRGPTSSAWLTCWRSYLEKLNVTFLNAKLLSLRNTCQQVSGNNAEGIEIILELPQIQPNYPIPPGTPAGVSGEDFIINKIRKAGFCVVALDPVAAEQVTAGWENAGVPADLRQFTSYVQVTFPALVDRYTITIPFSEPLNRQDAEERLRRILSRIQSVLKDDLESPRVRSAFRAMTKVTGELMPASDNQIEEYQISLWFQRRIGPEEILFIEEVVACWIAEEGGDQEPRLTSSQPEWYDEPATILTPRLPEQMYGLSPTDRFQTFTGIQYYFKQDFKMIRGHVYFPDSDWGLSAISQGQFWWWFSPNGAKRHDEVRGVLSVDIGACRTQSSYNGKTFFDSSPGEIADEVWRQVKESLRTMRGPNALFTSLPLPEPIYYHLDENLIYNGDKLSANLTPFPINNVGDWVWRPRCMPWVPGQSRFVDPPRTDGTDVWQASHGGYRVHNGQVVFCGHYMRTFTRMATMEAANESARHAVNAILDYLAENADEPKKGTHEKIASGDYCQIWDIEQHELDDLDFFKRVDEMLFKAGKPHMADILQFDKIADLQYPDPSPAQALAAALGVTLGKDWGVQPMELAGGLKGLSDVARQLGKDLGASYGYGGDASPFMGLLSVLTNGRIGGAGGNKQG